MTDYDLPGAAMAVVAAVAIYTAGFSPLGYDWRLAFLYVAVVAIVVTLVIELLHRSAAFRAWVGRLFEPEDERPRAGSRGATSLAELIDELTTRCPVCGAGPSSVTVRGPDEIVVDSCGHALDPTEWVDPEHRADALDAIEFAEAREDG